MLFTLMTRCTECFHPLSSSWYFVHAGTGRTQVLTLLNTGTNAVSMGGSRKLGYINFGFGLDTQPARSTGLVFSIVNFLVCIRSRFKNLTRSFEHREAGNRDVTSSMAQHHLYRRPGWLWRWSGEAPEFVECHVISTWCAYFLVLRWVPRGPERGVSDPTGIGIPLRSFSFLRSLFSLQENWE